MAQPSEHSDPLCRLSDGEWEAIYRQYSAELERFLTGVLRDRGWAQDVAQIAFTRLLERGGAVRSTSRKAWLFQVAMREALAQRRKAGRRQDLMERVFWHRRTDAEATDELAMRAEDVEEVRRALDQLPPAQREVVRRRVYDGQTFAEIAQELDIPLGTALGRMRSALARMRAWMAHRRTDT